MADTNIVQVIIKAIDETKGGFTQAIRGATDVETAFNKIKPAAIAASLAIALAMGVMTKQSIDAADEAAKLGQKVGVAVEDITTLTLAADLAGSSLDGLRVGFKTLAQFVTLASQGSKENQKLLDSLGLSYKNADGTFRDTKDLLFDIADQFKSMPDGIQKSDAAVRLLGKSGQDLIPLLNSGSEGIREMQQEARAFGLEVSGNTARAAEQFNDNLTRLHAVQRGYGNYLAEQFLPILNSLGDSVLESIRENGLWTDGINAALGPIKLFATGILTVAEGFNIVGGAAGTFAAVVEQLFRGNFSGAAEAWKQYAYGVADSVDALKIRLADLWVPDGSSVSAARAGGKEIAEAYVDSAAHKAEEERTKLESVLVKLFQNGAAAEIEANNSYLRQLEINLDRGLNTVEEFYSGKSELARKSAKAEIDALDLAAQASKRKYITFDIGSVDYENEKANYDKLVKEKASKELELEVTLNGIDNERRNRLGDIHIAEMDAIAAREQREEEADQRRRDREGENYERTRDLAIQLEAEKLQAKIDYTGSEAETKSGYQIEAVETYYQQARLLEDADYTARLEAIAKRDLAEEVSLELQEKAYAAHLLRKQKMDKDEDKAKKAIENARLAYTAQYLGTAANLAASFGKKGFEAYKAFAVAQAVISTYLAANRAFAEGGGWPLGAIFAAITVAQGLANVAKISSSNYGGGIAHGGMEYVPQETTYYLQRGERVLSPNQNSDLVQFLAQQNRPQQSGEVVLAVSGQPLFRLFYEATRSGELKFDARAVV